MTRKLYSVNEAAEQLGICRKVLLAHVESGELRFILIGKRRKFTDRDLDDFIERQACQFTDRKTPPTSTSISRSTVVDFTALQAKRRAEKPSGSKRGRERKP